VTDDWPEDVPVTEAEIGVFEAWFGKSRVPPARASEAGSSATRRQSLAAASHCNFTSQCNFNCG
jgi:hypothetical protein